MFWVRLVIVGKIDVLEPVEASALLEHACRVLHEGGLEWQRIQSLLNHFNFTFPYLVCDKHAGLCTVMAVYGLIFKEVKWEVVVLSHVLLF